MQVASLVLDMPPYIVANYKETQIGNIRAGQPVEILIDTFPGHTFKGHVESIILADLIPGPVPPVKVPVSLDDVTCLRIYIIGILPVPVIELDFPDCPSMVPVTIGMHESRVPHA